MSSLKRLSSSSSVRSKRDRKERKEGGSKDKTKKSSNMGGNVSRGIRHSHRDGGAGARAAAVKSGVANGESKMPTRLEMLLDMPYVPRETQVKHAWNSKFHLCQPSAITSFQLFLL